MITFSAPTRLPSRLLTRLRRAAGHGHGETLASRFHRAQDGMTLIEVVITSLIVGIVTLGTFAGFDALGKRDADQRQHNVASVLAAQSQEALRSDPAIALNELVSAGGHTYTQTAQGTKYTITQTAVFKQGSGETATCNAAAGHSAEASNYVRITSTVSWSSLGKARPPVTESSIITPPVGSALEVDVTNGGSPETPVSGVTVLDEGVETTTSENGCVLYNGIPSTTTEVEAFKPGYVIPNGEFTYFAKEVSIAPNVITHKPITLALGGYITAHFTYSGKPALGDTFVAANNETKTPPELIAGSTEKGFSFNGAGEYATVSGKYSETATSPREPTHYPNGNLFPFKQSWTVYAGDCSVNNPAKYKAAEEGTVAGNGVVPAGGSVAVTVPMSYVTLNVYKGITEAEGLALNKEYPIKITNLSCTSPLAATPLNAYKATYEHSNTTNPEAHLTNAYQPFGKFKMCLYSSGEKKTYTATYTNSTVAGSKVNLYIKHAAESYTEGSGKTQVEITVAKEQATNTC
jgi:prepilin-type N-terminal cleavage/methylation domain-containing protein